MKIISLIIIVPLIVFAQTEFHVSTATPMFNGSACEMRKDSLPFKSTLVSMLHLTSFLWNPDSLEWCTTKEGYYRSEVLSLWTIDNILYDTSFVFKPREIESDVINFCNRYTEFI